MSQDVNHRGDSTAGQSQGQLLPAEDLLARWPADSQPDADVANLFDEFIVSNPSPRACHNRAYRCEIHHRIF